MANKKVDPDLAKQVEQLHIERPTPSQGGATYVTVKKVIETEESYTVTDCPIYSPEQLQEGLEVGELNMIQVGTVESYVWIVDKNGVRVAFLSKDGGCGPNEKVTIEVS